VNNLHTFAIEKKAQRKRRMFNLKYSIKSCMFQESRTFPISAGLTSALLYEQEFTLERSLCSESVMFEYEMTPIVLLWQAWSPAGGVILLGKFWKV
jgi:hypothetical protein